MSAIAPVGCRDCFGPPRQIDPANVGSCSHCGKQHCRICGARDKAIKPAATKPLVWSGKTKADLLAALNTVLDIYVVGMAVPDLVSDFNWADLKTKILMVFVESSAHLALPLGPLSEKMQATESRIKLLQALHASHKRAASAEAYELVFSYCCETHQEEVFRAQPWYYFAQIVRHTASHGRGGFIEWPQKLLDKGVLEVEWRKEVIRSTMHGKELNLGASETHELLTDLIGFANTALK